MNARLRELFKNSLLFTVANLGSRILVFLMVPFYTTVLSSEQYGDANIVQTTANLLYPILTGLLADAVLRFCFIDKVDKNKVFSIGIRAIVVATLSCCVLLLLYLAFINNNLFGNYVYFLPAIVFAYSLQRVMHCFCRGIDKVKISASAGLIQTIIIILLNLLFLLYFKFGVSGYLTAFLLGDLLSAIYMIIASRAWKYFCFDYDRTLCKEMLKYSLPLVPNQISWWAVSSINQFIVLAFLGMSAVGIYTATLRIPTILTVLSDIFAQAWLLSALKDYGNEESKTFIKSMHQNFVSAITLLTSIIILLSYPLAIILLRGSFSDYWYIAPFLFVSVYLGSLTGFVGSIFSAEKKNNNLALSTVIGAIVIVATSFLLVEKFNILGIAISTLLGYYVIYIIRVIGVKKYIILNGAASKVSIYCVILIIESVLVINDQYIWGALAVILITGINFKILSKISLAIISETTKKLHLHKKGRS